MSRKPNPTEDLLLRSTSVRVQRDTLVAARVRGSRVASTTRAFAMGTLAAGSFLLAAIVVPSLAKAEVSIFPTLPRGTYVASQYTCTRYIEVGLLRFDRDGLSPPKSICKIVSADERTSTYQSICHEIDAPTEQERVTLKIEQVSKQAVRVNGVVYNYCKGL